MIFGKLSGKQINKEGSSGHGHGEHLFLLLSLQPTPGGTFHQEVFLLF